MHRGLRRAGRVASRWGRDLRVLPYVPERKTTTDWTQAYESGQLDYYGGLDELARYSLLVGYLRWVVRLTGQAPSVLDIGCGTGLLRRLLDDAPWTDYLGVDLSAAAIDIARAGPSERTRYLVGDVSTLDLGTFDVVVLNEVLYYVPDPNRFLQHVRTLLTRHGFMLLSVWRHPGDRQLWRTVENLFEVVDRVEVRNRANAVNRRGWVVASCRRIEAQPHPTAGGPSASTQGHQLQMPLLGDSDDAGKGRTSGASIER